MHKIKRRHCGNVMNPVLANKPPTHLVFIPWLPSASIVPCTWSNCNQKRTKLVLVKNICPLSYNGEWVGAAPQYCSDK